MEQTPDGKGERRTHMPTQKKNLACAHVKQLNKITSFRENVVDDVSSFVSSPFPTFHLPNGLFSPQSLSLSPISVERTPHPSFPPLPQVSQFSQSNKKRQFSSPPLEKKRNLLPSASLPLPHRYNQKKHLSFWSLLLLLLPHLR